MTGGRRLVIWAGAVGALVAGCSGGQPAASTETETPKGPPVVAPVVLSEMPHDTSAWIEGLEFDGPNLYEGTGIAGESEVRQLDPATGAVRRAVATPNNYYGEGIAVVGDRIWELTWQDGVAVEWDEATLRPLRDVPVDGEGWGLCHDGDRMIRSDGTDRLRFHDPQSFAETGSVDVTREGRPVRNLNELECVDGQVWANVWQTDMIVRIDPATGVVNAVVDATRTRAEPGPEQGAGAQRHRPHRRRRVPDHRQVLAEDVPGASRQPLRNSGPAVQGCPTHDLFDPHSLLADSRLAVLATIKGDGRPQLSPVTPFYDHAADVIYVSMTDGRAKTAIFVATPVPRSRSPAPMDGRGPPPRAGDPHRAGVRSRRPRGRGAGRLLPPRRRRAPGLGRVSVGDGLRSQGVDDDDGRARLRREDPLTRDGFTNGR